MTATCREPSAATGRLSSATVPTTQLAKPSIAPVYRRSDQTDARSSRQSGAAKCTRTDLKELCSNRCVLLLCGRVHARSYQRRVAKDVKLDGFGVANLPQVVGIVRELLQGGGQGRNAFEALRERVLAVAAQARHNVFDLKLARVIATRCHARLVAQIAGERRRAGGYQRTSECATQYSDTHHTQASLSGSHTPPFWQSSAQNVDRPATNWSVKPKFLALFANAIESW